MNDIVALLAHPWLDLGLALVVFSLAPDLLLRLLVLLYPKNSSRRRELVAELRVIPRVERPFWVAEQLTFIVSEGLGDRIRARRRRAVKVPDRYIKNDLVELIDPITGIRQSFVVRDAVLFTTFREGELIVPVRPVTRAEFERYLGKDGGRSLKKP